MQFRRCVSLPAYLAYLPVAGIDLSQAEIRHVCSVSIPLQTIMRPHDSQQHRQDNVKHHGRPQQIPHPHAANTEVSQVQRHERAVSQHSRERRTPRPATHAQRNQCDAGYPPTTTPTAAGPSRPAMSAPSNRRTTIGGYTSNARPVTASARAARARNFFVRPSTASPSRARPDREWPEAACGPLPYTGAGRGRSSACRSCR